MTINQFTIKSFPLASALRKAKFSSDIAKKISAIDRGEERLIKTLLLFKGMDKIPDYSKLRGSAVEQYQEDLIAAELKLLQRLCTNFITNFQDKFEWNYEKASEYLDRIVNLDSLVEKAVLEIEKHNGNNEALFAGVDAGGTSSRAVIVDSKGRILGKGIAGPSFPLAIGLERSVDNVIEAIKRASEHAKIDFYNTKFKRMCIGTAGIDKFQDHTDFLSTMIEDARYKRKIDFDELFVIQDGLLAWFSAFDGAPGVIVNGGTGDLIFGSNKGNDANNNMKELWSDWTQVIRLGGRMFGFHGARKVKELLAKGEKSHLVDVWHNHFSGGKIYTNYTENMPLITVLDFVEESPVTNTKLTITEVAAATRLVLEAAEKGDPHAEFIIKEGIESSVDYVKKVAQRIELTGEKFNLAIVGSVIKEPYIKQRFLKRVKEIEPNIVLIENKLKPEVGAAEIARKNIRFY